MSLKHPGFSLDASSHCHSMFSKVLLLHGGTSIRLRVTSFQFELRSKPKLVK